MKLTPAEIFHEYKKGIDIKSSLGNNGLYEQSKINERFYIGDQWHGAKCGNDRPLVRHNIIKRIGDYKMSQILSTPIDVSFSADGIPNTVGLSDSIKLKKSKISDDKDFNFSGLTDTDEINLIMSVLSDYHKVTANRIGLNLLNEQALRNAYIAGSSVVYTYWDSNVSTGLYADDVRNIPIKGDICSEVLDIENVYFGDPFLEDIQAQPYIIISALRPVDEVKREAIQNGADKNTLSIIDNDSYNSKITVLTRLFKEYKPDGNYTIKCMKVTENAIIRNQFDTYLKLYPIALFTWERKNNLIYGESEITYLIPNQIAINRMITANVWSAMTMGMPIMVINGDTVTGNITNEPGQIIKIFGSNEDVAGAVTYVTPPDFSTNFSDSITSLIENTLTQSGANEVALGDSKADNATALMTMHTAAVMPLIIIKNRFYSFMEQLSKIWVDFFISQYGNRRIKIEDENGVWYLPFNAERYADLLVTTTVQAEPDNTYSDDQRILMLNSLYEKGIITKKQYLKRLPKNSLEDINSIISEENENEGTDHDRI